MIKVYFDEYGYRNADPNGEHPLVASFFESDVQSDPSACPELLEIIAEVEDGRRLEWSGSFNAHEVTIRPDGAVIENLWDDSLGVAHLPLELFRDCIKVWAAFLSS